MESKDRILHKAAELFLRYGIRSITMDEIAAQLGISKKTIYQFFTDKDAIVESVIEEKMKSSETKFERFRKNSENAIHQIFSAGDDTEEMLKSMNPLMMYDLEKYHPRAHFKIREFIQRMFHDAVRENLLRGIREEVYRQDLNVEITSKLRIESIFMAFNQDVFPHNRFKMYDVFYELDLLFMHSVATLKGKKLIQKYSVERNKPFSHEKKD